MFWISAKLTLVMLCVVPPVSLFAVSRNGRRSAGKLTTGLLRPIPAEAQQRHARSDRRHEQGQLDPKISFRALVLISDGGGEAQRVQDGHRVQ